MRPIQRILNAQYLLVFLVFVCLYAKTQGQIFTKLTTDPSATDGGSSHSVSWGDYDNDGFLDLIVSHHAGQNNLFCHNNGTAAFTRITNSIVSNDGGDSYSGIWGDYDNDGWVDLFMANIGTNWLYHNNGDGTFSKVTNGNNISGGYMNSTAAAWGDYDNDGSLDLFVANYHGQHNKLYHNSGNGSFTEITNSIVVSDTPGASGCGWGDYDNDGFLDLFVSNPFSTNQLNLLYHNNGDGTFLKITNGPVVTEPANSYGCVWADYNNDGWLDLLVANNGQKNFLYRNDGNGAFTKITSGALVTDVAGFYNGAWADYDNDGWLDVFVANFTGNNFLYHNNEDGTFTKITSEILTQDGGRSAGCGWGDLDNDGALDLYVTNHGGNNFLYRNNGNTNHWIVLRLKGTLSNRSGIGAKIKLTTVLSGLARSQFRTISNGDGVGGGSLDAHFGLGQSTNIEEIQIQWPSGVNQQIRSVAANQVLGITEPGLQITASRRLDRNLINLRLLSRPNKILQLETSTNCTAWQPWITITNHTGRAEVNDNLNGGWRFYRARE